jgi:hypothetical protein
MYTHIDLHTHQHAYKRPFPSPIHSSGNLKISNSENPSLNHPHSSRWDPSALWLHRRCRRWGLLHVTPFTLFVILSTLWPNAVKAVIGSKPNT